MGADVELRQPWLSLWPLFVLILSQLMPINGFSADLLSVPERIPIGALFDHKHQNLQTIFRQTIHHHNTNESVKYIVETAAEFVDHNDPTRIVRQLQCLHFNRGIYAFLAPHFEAYAYKSALSFANTYRVPLVASSPLFPHHERSHSGSGYARDEAKERQEFYGINLEPNYWPAITSVLKWYHWTNLIYIYDSDYGIFELQELLKHSHRSEHRIQLSIVKRVSNAGEGYSMLKALDRETKDTMKYVILNCKLHISKAMIAYHIQDTAMERHTFHYLLTNLVLSDWWSKEIPVAFNAVNITSFALPTNKLEIKKMTHMKSLGHNNGLMDEERALSLEESLAYDGTRVLLEAFNLIIQSQINFSKALESEAPVVVSTVNLTKNHIDPTCPTLKPFKFGEVIANHLKITSTTGITGNIEFHSTGLRKNYSIEVFEITNNGLFEKIALWSDISGLKVLQPNRYRIGGEPTPTNQTLTYTITSILEDPFLMAKPEKKGVVLRGNDRFEGYVKDLIDLLAHMVGFEYTIHLVNDSRYGGYYGSNITDGRWNGMIGELIRHEVHMAIAPLTITQQRMSVVDFSHPFMTSGISMMFKKPNITPQDMFPFVRPLSKEVWAAVALAVVIVSFIFYIVSKLSYDYDIHDNSTDNNTTTVSLCSSLSYSIGVLVYQVSGVYPHSISSRIVSVVWWLFVFTIVSTYLANLTSNSVLNKMKFTLYHISGKYESISDGFLYYDQMPVPIASVDDLADQNVIDFGFLRNSATESYFKKSKLSIIWKMWKKVDEKSDQLLVNSYREGIQRVRDSDGQYVFLLESPVNDYINDRQPCNTYRVGKDINIVEYGVALPKGSPIRDKINEAIIQLKENGDLKKLQNHWWRDRSQCKYVDIKDLSNSNITFDNIIIGLIVLSAGLVLAFFVSIVEHFCNRKISYKTRQSNYTISKQEEREENIEDIEDKNSAKRRIIKN